MKKKINRIFVLNILYNYYIHRLFESVQMRRSVAGHMIKFQPLVRAKCSSSRQTIKITIILFLSAMTILLLLSSKANGVNSIIQVNGEKRFGKEKN